MGLSQQISAIATEKHGLAVWIEKCATDRALRGRCRRPARAGHPLAPAGAAGRGCRPSGGPAAAGRRGKRAWLTVGSGSRQVDTAAATALPPDAHARDHSRSHHATQCRRPGRPDSPARRLQPQNITCIQPTNRRRRASSVSCSMRSHCLRACSSSTASGAAAGEQRAGAGIKSRGTQSKWTLPALPAPTNPEADRHSPACMHAALCP